MKKLYIVFTIILFTILSLNLLFYFDLYRHQVNYQKNILFQQAESSVGEIEKMGNKFQSDLNYILFSDDIAGIFNNEGLKEKGLNKFKMFYSVYSNLVQNLHIYDSRSNVINLFKDKNNNFITDNYTAQRQRKLIDREMIVLKDGKYQYYLPVFKDNKVEGNIVITLKLSEYINEVLLKYKLKNSLWQWVYDINAKSLTSNLETKSFEIRQLQAIIDQISNNVSGFINHKAFINNKEESILSVYSPVSLLQQKFGIVFSLNNSIILNVVLNKVLIIGIISLLLLIGTLIYFLRVIKLKHTSAESVLDQKSSLEKLIDSLPIGIMILDENQRLEIINQTAREMLLFKDDEELTGKDISNKFVLSKNYFEDEIQISAFDSNQFILFQKEGNEVVIFKKEVPYTLRDKNFVLAAFIDITPIEKARKYEAASNTAKSEFLAKMSHEIRTPMNGIIGMTEALDQKNLSKSQKEYVSIVRKSADLLLNIIDDILDYSKIEAGKMQLEEIPFRLRDEVKICLDLFKPIIEEKGLALTSKIADKIPDHIIGDPFRLRQVLSNLVSNAVKFTHMGKIAVGVELEEEYSGNLTLLFYVEDTGVGIPKEKIESIFNSFTQAESSISRKYGGSGLGTTIAKQLVTLMHGEIWVESPVPRSKNKKYPGSRFSFTIEVFSNERPEKNLDFKDITKFEDINSIILTQDIKTINPLTRFLDFYKITSENIEVDQSKPDEIKNLLSEYKDRVQVLFFMDDSKFNVIKLCKLLNKEKITDKFFIFMISSNHRQDNFVQSKLAGIDYYLIEPFENNDLKEYLYESFQGIKRIEEKTMDTIRPDLTILVAEDNIINQRVADIIFNNLGYQIDMAGDGREVVEKVTKKCYDIIFMDLSMPELSGIDATVEIRAMGHQMPIVAMTASANKESKKLALQSGMNDYIVKPVKLITLRKVLLKWFA